MFESSKNFLKILPLSLLNFIHQKIKFSKINYFELINTLFPEFKRLVSFKSLNKKRILLKNSYLNESLLHKYFHKTLEYDKLSSFFYNQPFFAYANHLEEKDQIISYLKQYCPLDIKQYLEYSEQICEYKFKIFEKEFRFSNKINWHYSFFENYDWPLKNSEKIDLYPMNKEIDIKYTWEFNRHQFLPYLGFAYYYTNNEKYAKVFKEIILDWIEKNPPLKGVNWYSGLEISIRLISWIFSLLFFKESKEINNIIFFKKIFISMFQHAYYLKYFYVPRKFNHTVGDLFGIYFFLKLFENIKLFVKWKKKFFKKFEEQILLQTRLDGTNIEQSVNYHRFVLEFFTLFLILNSNTLDKNIIQRIEGMFYFLIYILKPNKTLPKIGDFDDGKMLLLTHSDKNSHLQLINLGAILFCNSNFKFISNRISPLSVLLLGIKGIQTFEKIEAHEPKENFKFFENAGRFIIRDSWTDKANYLFIDFGKFGPQNAGHSHSSITNCIFSYKGKEILIDSGSYNYNKSLNERNYFRSSWAHNILTINHKNQAIIKSRFEWDRKPKIRRIIQINKNLIKLICYHNGYPGFITKRQIKTNQNLSFIVIKDTVLKNQKAINDEITNIDINFHFHKNIDIDQHNNKLIINNELIWKIKSKQRLNICLKKSFFSPIYGVKSENKMLNIHLEEKFNKNREIKITNWIIPKN